MLHLVYFVPVERVAIHYQYPSVPLLYCVSIFNLLYYSRSILLLLILLYGNHSDSIFCDLWKKLNGFCYIDMNYYLNRPAPL